MSDSLFPAHITVDRTVDLDGVAVLTAAVTVAPETAVLDLPKGPKGPDGPPGRPRTTFQKMGAIANIAARPTGLGAEDCGKWWHRLDDNGMDVWDGTGWRHSPNAVGAQGEIAAANTITVTDTKHDEKLTAAAVEISGTGAAQQMKVTVPAGPTGVTGSAGESGQITASPDYDPATGVSNRAPFGFSVAARKFRASSPPNGYGPWAWYETDFAATVEAATEKIVAGQFTVPALPFVWRPIVYGHMFCSIDSSDAYFRASVRLFTTEGVIVSGFRSKIGTNANIYTALAPLYADDESTRAVSPTSTYATVPAGQPANLVVCVERLGANFNSTVKIGFNQAAASLVVFAQPV
uniref:hypothetical protein n=1 Tax=Nocardia suismassiliense TaxID=2077092 RepID=UPI003F499E40